MSHQSFLVKAVLIHPSARITEVGMLDYAKERELLDITAHALESVVMEKNATRETFWHSQQLQLHPSKQQRTKEQFLSSVLWFYCLVWF